MAQQIFFLRTAQQQTFMVWAFCLLCLLSVPFACGFGSVDISATEVWSVLHERLGFAGQTTGATDATTVLIIWDLRMARVLLGFLCGMGLGLAGLALQGVLRNPLADAFTLGISSGAACGASLAIVLGGLAGSLVWFTTVQPFFLSLSALIGALTALAFALLLGRAGGRFRKESVILAGVAVSATLGALVTLIKALNEDSVASIVFWIMGSLQGRSWPELRLFMPLFALGLILVLAHWRSLDVFALGDEEAASLGVRVERSRILIMTGASCMAASCVAVSGIIGFVGLVVPHIMRLLVGSRHALLLPLSAFGGGILLVWADVLARSLLDNGVEIPVGVVTSLLGGPFFALLVARSHGARHD